MANIRITGSILNTSVVSRYSIQDERLLAPLQIQENFGSSNDRIEYYLYDIGGNLLYREYNYQNYKSAPSYGLTPAYQTLPNTNNSINNLEVGITSNFTTNSAIIPVIEIDPVLDIQTLGYSSGEFIVRYNFFENKISDSSAELFIKEISSDRTELRIGSTVLSNEEIETAVNNLINESTGSIYFQDYLLNFGNNIQALAVNVALNAVDPNYEIFFKLYEPLPLTIEEKTSFWVVKEKVNAYDFDINLDKLVFLDPALQLRGPNFSIPVKDQGNVTTAYQSYNNLVSPQTSSYNQLLNLISSQSIKINVDYSDFNNFIFFGSAEARVTNFYNKISQIEIYNNLINTYIPLSASIINLKQEINLATSSIQNIISNFDRFEYYLYFESSSVAVSSNYGINSYPKSSSLKPYILYSTSSATVISWYNSSLTTARNYDNYNVNNLIYTVPSYITNNSDNQPYFTFLNMIGHYFDDIWVTLKAVTDINLANNNLDKGISKDLIYTVLQSLGISLHNSLGNQDLFQYFIGANTGSVTISSSLNDFSATSSYLNNIPRQDLLAESYKRIYHNLPLLLKQKGTTTGLETLISIFGVPSKTYITGSTISSSILDVKEYGGSFKKDIIVGYNSNKVRIINNTITGSVLSPFISVQMLPSNSSTWRNADEHYVDVSFSPQNQIDTYISKSISSSNSNWVIDDFIGDPGYLYSGSYADLDAQKTAYFSQGVGAYSGFTGSLLDYNGFIRLIQFFDNSLFKMLENYVPARTSLSTGVTINSPALERNKATYANPENSTKIAVYQPTYSIASISPQYGPLYNNLQGNKSPFFTGELSGSQLDAYQYFIDSNFNPYLGDWNTYNSQHAINESINFNRFLHSEQNILLNNVSKSITSRYRRKIEPLYGTTASISTPAELQDSYLSLTSYDNSRYKGTQIYSLVYNTYTSASSTYAGDNSYGKTAVIDCYTRKIGLFTQIESSSFLPQRNIVSLKYLVDEKGNLTDLNQINKHWEEIQRLFVIGDITTIALFDNQKFATNQRFTDGPKTIYESGYSYDPVLYFSFCNNSKLYFTNLTGLNSYLAKVNNTSPYFISGSGGAPNYPISSSYVNGIFNNIIEGSSYFTPGTFSSPPSYSVQEAGDHLVRVNLNFSASITSNTNIITSSLLLYKNSSTLLASSSVTFNLSTTASAASGTLVTSLVYADSGPTIQYSFIKTSNKVIHIQGTNYPPGTDFYVFPNGYGDGYSGCTATGFASGGYSLDSSYEGTNLCPDIFPLDPLYEYSVSFFDIPDFDSEVRYISQSTTLGILSTVSGLTIGDKLNIRLNVSSSNSNFTASVSEGFLSINSLATSTGYLSADCPFFYTSSMNSGSNLIVFKPDLGNLVNSSYQFVPNPLTGSINSLYSSYGEVNYPLFIKPYDLLVVQLADDTYIESKILEVTKLSGGYLQLTLDTILSSTYMDSIIQENYKKFLILSRRQDETNMYLVFSKTLGQTSYGFAIPSDISPDILANIDAITKEVKQKLLSDTQGII